MENLRKLFSAFLTLKASSSFSITETFPQLYKNNPIFYNFSIKSKYTHKKETHALLVGNVMKGCMCRWMNRIISQKLIKNEIAMNLKYLFDVPTKSFYFYLLIDETKKKTFYLNFVT